MGLGRDASPGAIISVTVKRKRGTIPSLNTVSFESHARDTSN